MSITVDDLNRAIELLTIRSHELDHMGRHFTNEKIIRNFYGGNTSNDPKLITNTYIENRSNRNFIDVYHLYAIVHQKYKPAIKLKIPHDIKEEDLESFYFQQSTTTDLTVSLDEYRAIIALAKLLT